MSHHTVVVTLERVNDELAATARRTGGAATFVCECGRCSGSHVPLSLEEFERHRDRQEPVLALGHT
jgi:hypothetical protein